VSPILGIYASQISGHLFAPSGAYDSIATAVGTGSSDTITFSSIPQTYTHLEIRGIAQANASLNDYGAVGVRFNSDSGTNYTRHRLTGNGTTAGAAANTSTTFADGGPGAVYLTSGTSTVGTTVISVLDYTSTSKYTTIRALSGTDNNGIGLVSLSSGLWLNTNAVTSITLYQQNGNFTDKTTFALYGIKGN
jgi:hypothetical protein